MKNLLIEAQGLTILALVNEIFLKGEFVCPFKDEAKEGEVVLGELLDYEKAIVLASHQAVDRHNAIVEKEIEGGEDNSVQKYLDKFAHEVFDKLLWASIHHRFGKVAVESDTLDIRKDWKIVVMSEEEEDKDCASCPAAFMCPGAH